MRTKSQNNDFFIDDVTLIKKADPPQPGTEKHFTTFTWSNGQSNPVVADKEGTILCGYCARTWRQMAHQ